MAFEDKSYIEIRNILFDLYKETYGTRKFNKIDVKVKNSKKINRFLNYCNEFYVPSHDDIGACLHEIYWILFSSAETFLLASFFVLERINNEVYKNCKELSIFLDKKSIAVDLIILARDFQLDGFTRSNLIKEIFEKHGEDYNKN